MSASRPFRRGGLLGPRPVLAVAILICLAAAAMVVALPLWRLGAFDLSASADALIVRLRSWGPAAPLASVVLMVAHSFIPFPAELLAVANGVLFGLPMGVAVTWAGAMLGAIAAFALARWLGRPFVRRLVGEARWAALEARAIESGPKALLLARLIPVISFNLVNYAAGLAGIGWGAFLWTTAVGILPVTVASVLVGSHMVHAPWPAWVVLVALAAAAMLLHRRYGRQKPPTLRQH